MELRENQIEPVRIGCEFFQKEKVDPSIIVAPTAFGKSIVIAKIAESVKDNLLILQPSKELLSQNYEKYVALGGRAHVYSASFNSRRIGAVTFATVGSIFKIGKRFKDLGFTKLICDECHLFPRSEGMIHKFLKDSEIQSVLGLTATPLKLQSNIDQYGNPFSKLVMLTANSKKGKFFKEIISVSQIQDIVKLGFWAKLEYEQYFMDETGLKYNSTKADFTEESLKKVYESNNMPAKIIQKIIDMKDRKSIIVFVPGIEDAISLSRQVPGSAAIYSGMPDKERMRAVVGFKNLSIRTIFNVSILCLDSQTEILTKDGWANINTIKHTDKVANWNMNGSIFFQEPKGIVIRDTKEDEFFVTIKSREMNFRVTNNHDMIIGGQYKKQKTWKKVKASSIISKCIEVPTCGYAGIPEVIVEQEIFAGKLWRRISANAFNLRKHGMGFEDSKKEALKRIENRNKLKYKNPKELLLDECWLIGFWIGDGSVNKGKKNQGTCYSLAQALSYPNIIKEIEGVLHRLNINYNTYTSTPKNKNHSKAINWNLSLGTGFGEQNKSGIYHLIPYLDKKGCQYLRGLNRDQLKNLLVGFWYADGNHGLAESVPNSLHISNTDFSLLSFLQELCITRGFSANVTTTTKQKNPNHKQMHYLLVKLSGNSLRISYGKQKTKKENISIAEKVWCVESSSGNIITRRGGKVCIMGNSVGFDHPQLDAIIMARPTASLTWLYQAVGRGTRIHPLKKDCLIVDFSGNIKRFGRIEHLHFVKEGSLWKLYGEFDNLLSGIPLHEVGTYKKNPSAAPATPNGEYIMKFGKHKGQPVSMVPSSYREWMLGSFEWNERNKDLKEALEKSLSKAA